MQILPRTGYWTVRKMWVKLCEFWQLISAWIKQKLLDIFVIKTQKWQKKKMRWAGNPYYSRCINWASSWENVSSGVSDQVRLKLACSATEASKRLEILVTETRDITLSRHRTTKALIRLRGSDCADVQADLRLCCSHMTQDTFSHGPAQFILNCWKGKFFWLLYKSSVVQFFGFH